MLQAFSTPRRRNQTLLLLALCALCAVAAAIVGISDNPPGILLAMLAGLALVFAFVHPWQSARSYLLLLVGSIGALVVFAVLHNVFEGVSGALTGPVRSLVEGAGVVFFLLAVLLCPPAFLVGVIGSLALALRKPIAPPSPPRQGGAGSSE